MRLSRINFLLLFVIVFSCDSKKDFEGDFKKYFIKYYGEDGAQEGIDLIAMEDTVWLLGTTRTDNNVSRIMLIQTDAEGNVRWEKKFGGTQENARDIELTPAGDFLILSNMFLGQDIGTNENIYKFKVLRVSRDGTKLDSVVFGDVWTTQYAHSVTALSDGGFIVTGNTTDENFLTDTGLAPPDQEDLMAVIFNSNLTVRTTNVSTSAEYIGAAVKAFEKGNGQYYFFTYSDRTTGGGDIKFESNFNPFIFYDNGSLPTSNGPAGTATRDEILKYVCRMPGGFYEIGTSSVLPETAGTLYYATRSQDLSLIDEGTIDAGDNLIAAAATYSSSGGFLIVATEVLPTGSTIRLIKTNISQRREWSATFGAASKVSVAGNVAELQDGRVLVIGTIELETQKKIALIKVNSAGEFMN